MLQFGDSNGPCACIVASHERHMARLIEVNLRRQGYTPSVAHDAATALALVERGDFGLVVVDDHLPELDGLKLLRAIRQNEATKRAFVAILTARADKFREEDSECQADWCISTRPTFWDS